MRTIGANYIGEGRCLFTVWAPDHQNVTLHIVEPEDRLVPIQAAGYGYFGLELESVYPGTRYFFRLENGSDYPDPASYCQPDGVHGPSEVIDHNQYNWRDQTWRGLPFRELIFYQLHVGTFTPEGTFDAIIPRLKDLADLGINAIQLLPISQFPGDRNWGYDGVYMYSVQSSYGGPEGLKRLVDVCHSQGIAVFLDVVYNHVGPEGNYFSQFGPYFTDKYQTPWGDAVNFDREWSDGVRAYFDQNALFWFDEYHVDGLRFDAIHEVYDRSAVSIWEQIHAGIKQLEQRLGRSLYLVAESDLNSPRVVKPPEMGGYGFTGQWLDDFHHAFHVLINKPGQKKYPDFGRMEQLAKAYTDGFVQSGNYVSFRKQRFGESSAELAGDQFIVFNLNHDQIGNLSGRERLSQLVDFDRQKVAAAAILLSPYIPLLFMGEEYAEDTPFYYFISHSDPKLIQQVREGHQKDFEQFNDGVELPDPIEEATFIDSKLQWHKRTEGKHQLMLDWHRLLIQLRRTLPALRNVRKNDVRAQALEQSGLALYRQTDDGQQHVVCLFNLSDEKIAYTLPLWVAGWNKLVESTEKRWQESGKAAGRPLPDQVKPGQKVQLLPRSVTLYAGTLRAG